MKSLLITHDKEMRTTRGNKEVLQAFFHISPYLQKYNLIRLTS